MQTISIRGRYAAVAKTPPELTALLPHMTSGAMRAMLTAALAHPREAVIGEFNRENRRIHLHLAAPGSSSGGQRRQGRGMDVRDMSLFRFGAHVGALNRYLHRRGVPYRVWFSYRDADHKRHGSAGEQPVTIGLVDLRRPTG